MSGADEGTSSAPPPRLHVLIARDKPRAVVIRRGPSRVCSVFLWDLKTDAFSLGQGMRARLYERRCDLSPDGEHFLYFALNGRWNTETRGSWTAISRAPYLKALTLYAKGDGWNGGGHFLDNKSYLLNERYRSHDLLFDHLQWPCVRGVPPPVHHTNSECLGLYYPRLARDGWLLNEVLSEARVQVFEKPWRGPFALRKYCHVGKGPRPGGVYTDSHALVRAGEVVAAFPLWEWADVVKRRLLWAEAGAIFATSAFPDANAALADVQRLHDFNGMAFEAREAPY